MSDPSFFMSGEVGSYVKITGLLGGTNMAAIHLSKAVGGSLFWASSRRSRSRPFSPWSLV